MKRKKDNNKTTLLIIGGLVLVVIVGIVIANLIMKGSGSGSFFAKTGGVCGYGCSNCSTKGTCTKCYSGYKLQNGKCVTMSCNISGCEKCSSPNKCASCKSGYSLTNNNCVKCKGDNCVSCKSDGTCTRCSSGYYVDSGQCKTCSGDRVIANNGTRCCIKIANCNQYDGNCSCTKCASGYATKGNTCYKCQTGCTSCNPNNGYCTACQSGYTLTRVNGGGTVCRKTTATYNCTMDNYKRPVEYCREQGYKEGKANCTPVYKATMKRCVVTNPITGFGIWGSEDSITVTGNCKTQNMPSCNNQSKNQTIITKCELKNVTGTITCTFN